MLLTMRYALNALVVTVGMITLLTACGRDDTPTGAFELRSSAAEAYPTAYVAVVVADPPGDDLSPGSGEHVVIRNNADIRIDMGGWSVETNGHDLPLGIGLQINPGSELLVHPGPGATSGAHVFVGLDQEVLADDRGVVVLRDAAGSEVSRFEYGGDHM